MKCPICKFAKCRWIELNSEPSKLKTEELDLIVQHNMDYIEMIYKGHQGSAHSEERMYLKLTPYTDELERRKGRLK